MERNKKVTVRELINLLIGADPEGEVIIRDSDSGMRLSGVSICVIESEKSIGALFG